MRACRNWGRKGASVDTSSGRLCVDWGDEGAWEKECVEKVFIIGLIFRIDRLRRLNIS